MELPHVLQIWKIDRFAVRLITHALYPNPERDGSRNMPPGAVLTTVRAGAISGFLFLRRGGRSNTGPTTGKPRKGGCILKSDVTMKASLTFLMFLLCLPTASQAADFDCSSARTTLEVLICADPELSALDAQVGEAYSALDSALPDSPGVLNQQRDFLRKRTEICPIPFTSELSDSDTSTIIFCLKGFYTLRLNELQKQLAGQPYDSVNISATTNAQASGAPVATPQPPEQTREVLNTATNTYPKIESAANAMSADETGTAAPTANTQPHNRSTPGSANADNDTSLADVAARFLFVAGAVLTGFLFYRQRRISPLIVGIVVCIFTLYSSGGENGFKALVSALLLFVCGLLILLMIKSMWRWAATKLQEARREREEQARQQDEAMGQSKREQGAQEDARREREGRSRQQNEARHRSRRKQQAQEDAQRHSQRRHAGYMTIPEARDVLGLTEPFTQQDVKSAYKALVQKVHPDAGGSTYLMQLANRARDILSDD
jgi:uncharacterized protein